MLNASILLRQHVSLKMFKNVHVLDDLAGGKKSIKTLQWIYYFIALYIFHDFIINYIV